MLCLKHNPLFHILVTFHIPVFTLLLYFISELGSRRFIIKLYIWYNSIDFSSS